MGKDLAVAKRVQRATRRRMARMRNTPLYAPFCLTQEVKITVGIAKHLTTFQQPQTRLYNFEK